MLKKLSGRFTSSSVDSSNNETTTTSSHVSRTETAEQVSAAASTAASSMYGFMKKAGSAATVMMKEGTAKAVDYTNKAVAAADMDALQKRLGVALDMQLVNVDPNALNFTYLADNLIAMGFPGSSDSSTNGVMRYNPIDSVSYLLNEKHLGHYMIWNLSEEPYDYSKFQDQVLEFKFPGHPAPPLGVIFRICTSMESWLGADAKNVAVSVFLRSNIDHFSLF